MAYEVYLYTLPRISGDGKSIPGPDSKRRGDGKIPSPRLVPGGLAVTA